WRNRPLRSAIRKHLQKQVQERRVADRPAELEAANKALRDSDRLKDEFLATLAHELRNPLAPIRNALEIQRLMTGNAEAMEQARGVIARQVGQLVRLIDDLLDASRITRDKLRLVLERLDLRDVLVVAIEASQPLIDKAGLTLEVILPEEPLVMEGDRVRLSQIFTNLLNNAAKYTERGGRVTLRVESDGDSIRVSVADTGMGIPSELLPR